MRWLLLNIFISAATAAVHNLFVGNLNGPSSVHSLAFDDETNNLTKLHTFEADASHAWITFSHDKKNIYGVSLNKSRVASYKVTSPTTIELTRNVTFTGACKNKTSAFVTAEPIAPYRVYAAAWPGPNACGIRLSVDGDGVVDTVTDTWTYAETSGVHGLALASRGGRQLLYSADLNGDLLWTHATDGDGGRVTEVGRLKMVKSGMHPRHLTVHPNGSYVYVVMEAGNALVQFSLNTMTNVAARQVASYSLIPDGKKPADYWSAEVMLSASGRYLWATARTYVSTETGYISAFLLGDDGAIVKHMFMVPTTAVGGIADAISPAPWSDEYAALADTPNGYVQMWKLDGRNETAHGVEYATVKPIAKVDIKDGGCCANVIWYN